MRSAELCSTHLTYLWAGPVSTASSTAATCSFALATPDHHHGLSDAEACANIVLAAGVVPPAYGC